MDIREIILAFDSLSKSDSKYLNIFQIMRTGYSEKVSSNIIAHFAGSNDNLDIKNALIKALATVLKINSLDGFFDTFSKTEVVTAKGNKIDILVGVNNSNLFIIENKIYHKLNNDLDDYFNFIDKNEEYSKYKKHFVVLSLHPIKINHPAYKNITHDKLCKEFKKIYGANLIQQNIQSMLITEYCNNMINLSGNHIHMNNEIYPFTEKYYYKIREMMSMTEGYSSFSKEKIISLKDYYEETKNQYQGIINSGTYLDENLFSKKFLAVFFVEFNYKDIKYAIDVNFSIDGWDICIFCRDKNKIDKKFIEDVTDKQGDWREKFGPRYYLSDVFPDRNTSNEKIMNVVDGILSKTQNYKTN